MKIFEIAEKLNTLAIQGNFEIAKLPEYRKKYLGKSHLPSYIFTDKTIFSKGESIYAFHYGGRDEMQFNIGVEELNRSEIIRVALCFSLEPSRSLTNPIEKLLPYKERFNHFLKNNQKYFMGFEMWYYKEGKRSKNYKPQEIDKNLFQNNTFISVGFIIRKPLDKINNTDLNLILEYFDRLLPIYKYCVLELPINYVNEKKISRICYNIEGWVKPSGMEGKSKLKDSYEFKTGFGHEEWLFDFDKLINGFHYGFLQAIGNVPSYKGKTFDISLFTINSDSKERIWVAQIRNVYVINETEQINIFNQYVKNGWLNQMKEDLRVLEIDKRLIDGKRINLNEEITSGSFNIRFKPDDICFINRLFGDVDFNNVKAEYYKLYDTEFIPIENREDKTVDQKPKSPPQDPPLKSQRVSRPRLIELSKVHYDVAKGLYNSLINIYGKRNVYWEYNLNYGARVDVAVNDNNNWIFFEVKSYIDLRTSIREALGQLLEYSHWPGRNKASKLVIVTQKISGIEKVKNYMSHLRERYGISIYYCYYDLETGILSEMV